MKKALLIVAIIVFAAVASWLLESKHEPTLLNELDCPPAFRWRLVVR